MAIVFRIIFSFLIAGLLGDKRKIGGGWSFTISIFITPVLGLILSLCSKKKEDNEGLPNEKKEKNSRIAGIIFLSIATILFISGVVFGIISINTDEYFLDNNSLVALLLFCFCSSFVIIGLYLFLHVRKIYRGDFLNK